MALPSGFASASVCSVSSASGYASHDPRSPRPIPPWKKHIKKLQALMQDDNVDLWATRRGALSAAWLALPHVDPARNQGPVLLHAPTRKSVGYFGAVRLRDGRFVFRLETGKFNGPSFLQFLQQLRSASRGTRRRVVVIADNARYHHSRLHRPWREYHAHHFALDFLPAYSPELNPIERVWKLTRRRCLHNRYFDNLQDVIGAVESEFATWTTRNDVLWRLCAIT